MAPAASMGAVNSGDEGSIGGPDWSKRYGEVGRSDRYAWCRNRFPSGIAHASRIDSQRARALRRHAQRTRPRLVRPAATLVVFEEREIRQRVSRDEFMLGRRK